MAQPIENPKGQSTNGNSRLCNSHFEHAKSVTILRSEKVVDNKVQKVSQEPKDNPEEQFELGHREGKEHLVDGKEPEVGKATTPLVVENEIPTSKPIDCQNPTSSKCIPFFPLPQRLKKQEKKESTYETLGC